MFNDCRRFGIATETRRQEIWNDICGVAQVADADDRVRTLAELRRYRNRTIREIDRTRRDAERILAALRTEIRRANVAADAKRRDFLALEPLSLRQRKLMRTTIAQMRRYPAALTEYTQDI